MQKSPPGAAQHPAPPPAAGMRPRLHRRRDGRHYARPPTSPDDPFPNGRQRVHIQIDDFDSFNDAMDAAPWLVGVVFLVLGSIFLTPILLLVGIIWYKLRKTRLQNEAMLRLAERGVMPTAQAVDAVMAGTRRSAAGRRPARSRRGRSASRKRSSPDVVASYGRICARACS